MKKEKFLDEILNSPKVGDLRLASLEAGLGAMRGKRRRRNVARYSAGVVTAMLAVAGVLHFCQRGDSPGTHEANGAKIAIREGGATPAQGEAAPAPGVKIIDADQLLSLFPDRPVALVGSPGKQRLIFLDEQGTTGQP